MIYSAISQRHRRGLFAFLAAQKVDNPLNRWRLKETSGTTATEGIASNNGTYGGTLTLGQSGPWPGVLACDFNGGQVDSFGTALPNGLSDFSFEAIVYPNGTARMGIVGVRPTSASLGWAFTTNRTSQDTMTFFVLGGMTLETAGGIMVQNTWQHVGITCNVGGNAVIYRNGSSVASATYTTPAATSYAGRIGGEQLGNSSVNYKGKICFATFYSSILSSTRMLEHAKAGGFA